VIETLVRELAEISTDGFFHIGGGDSRGWHCHFD
jgi:hypothetical protein